MGTMVGDDGSPGTTRSASRRTRSGSRPRAANSSSCSTSSLLAAGQWILAPTDLNGQNPRPDLRPNIVNNSWGGGGGDHLLPADRAGWVAAGIFPAFSNGNAGPSCSSAGSPGDYPESYAAGAYDINNAIASFSSRGPSAFGGLDQAEHRRARRQRAQQRPRQQLRQLHRHLDGVAALADGRADLVGGAALIGDIAATRAILDQTAVDTADLGCGGAAENNNVWGEGRLDVFAAINQAPRGPTGTLGGTVTTAGGTPIAGASIHAQGAADRNTVSDARAPTTSSCPSARTRSRSARSAT